MKGFVFLSWLIALSAAAPQRGGGCGCREVICPNSGPDVGQVHPGDYEIGADDGKFSIARVLMRRPMIVQDIRGEIVREYR